MPFFKPRLYPVIRDRFDRVPDRVFFGFFQVFFRPGYSYPTDRNFLVFFGFFRVRVFSGNYPYPTDRTFHNTRTIRPNKNNLFFKQNFSKIKKYRYRGSFRSPKRDHYRLQAIGIGP
jgi:hypothetical protein